MARRPRLPFIQRAGGHRARRRVPPPPPTPLQRALVALHTSATPEVFLLVVEALLWEDRSYKRSGVSLYLEAPVLAGAQMAKDIEHTRTRGTPLLARTAPPATAQDAADWMLKQILAGRYYGGEGVPAETEFEPYFPWLAREFQKLLDEPPPVSATPSASVLARRLQMPYFHPVRRAQRHHTHTPVVALDGTPVPEDVNLEVLTEDSDEVDIQGKKVTVPPGIEAVRLPDGHVLLVERKYLEPGRFNQQQMDSNYAILRLARALPRIRLWASHTQPDLTKLKYGQVIWRAKRWKSPAEKRQRLAAVKW